MAEIRSLLFVAVMATVCLHGNAAQLTDTLSSKKCTETSLADIVFLLDGSSSITVDSFKEMLLFLQKFIQNLDVGADKVRVGVAQYSDQPYKEFLLKDHMDKASLLDQVSKIQHRHGGTFTGRAITFLQQTFFTPKGGSRAAVRVPQIAVVITDGESSDDMLEPARQLRQKGVNVFAIDIGGSNSTNLQAIVNRPHERFLFSISNYQALQQVLDSLLQILCVTVEDQRTVLLFPQKCTETSLADIVFLLDGSSSITPDSFKEMLLFLQKFIQNLNVGADKVRVGVAQYSDQPYKEFLLKDHMDEASLLQQVSKIQHRHGGTFTGRAITFLQQTFFTPEGGSRAAKRVPQIAVVITDGDSSDDVLEPARMLRQNGVIVFAIDIGSSNSTKLHKIANRPHERFLFSINNYHSLQQVLDRLVQTLCVTVEDQRTALVKKYSDIYFLVDSGLKAADLLQTQNMMVRLVNQLSVGDTAHRIGLARYGQDTEVEFLPNQHMSKKEVVASIKGLSVIQGMPNAPHNLGGALNYAATNFFSPMAGSRQHLGFRQFLVVMSGANSSDSIYQPARLLKSEGVAVIGIGLGSGMTDQMKTVASAPYVFQSTNIVPMLKKAMETGEKHMDVVEDCVASRVADVVFIVDESGSIEAANFQLVLSFLHNMVGSLDVQPNRIRVGIVMYSDNPAGQVYLDTFDNKNEILQFIKILHYHGGGTKTGLALKFARENIFVKERGSRKSQGVQQVAVVITDGGSQDEVEKEAADLRRDGVTVYAIGIKDANETQLVQIASHPWTKYVYNVDNFVRLKTLQKSLGKTMCHNIFREAIAVNEKRTDIKEGCMQTDEADIFFLIDQSGSIQPDDFEAMKKFVIGFLNTYHIGPDHIRIGCVKYADSPTLEFDLNTYTDSKTMEKAVEEFIHVGGGTKTGRGLSFMAPLFERAKKTRGHNVPVYLIVITDGMSTDKVQLPAEKLRNQGVNIYAIGVKKAVEKELQEIAGSPQNTFLVNNFDALKIIKDHIIAEICSQEACKDIPGDLLFLIDSSGSIGSDDYQKMKDFMKAMIGKSQVGKEMVHVGVMQFSTIQTMVFQLNNFYDEGDMLKAIDNMQKLGGGTHTGQALKEVSLYFDLAKGGRPGIRKNLIVITDGESTDQVKGPADILRQKGVTIFSIGVVNANTTQLLEISGSNNLVLTLRDFDALKDFESELGLHLCERECQKTQMADVIFLVDGSSSITVDNFLNMLNFMQSVVNMTTVGEKMTRFGVVLYSNEPKSKFTLKEYFSKRQVLNAIQALKSPTGDTYTGKALNYTLQFFDEQYGGRQAAQVPQILMVITDGEATDPDDLKAPSEALREKGISVFSIGVKGASKKELEIMAGEPSRVFFVDNFDALKTNTLYSNVSSGLCNTTISVCKKEKADLVLLVVTSETISDTDFSNMTTFMTDLIGSFKISKDQVRVGVAQFSRQPRKEFHLNQFYTVAEVTKNILNMVPEKEGTWVGLALDFIKTYFETSTGSRISSSIPQNLVVMIDGVSKDDVVQQAEVLREMGIRIFVIGVGDVNKLELKKITADTNLIFTVQNFGALAKIKQKVVDTICETPDPGLIHGCSIDVAIGFDMSQRSGNPLVSGFPKLRVALPEILHYVSTLKGLCCVQDTPIEPNVAFRLVGQDGRVLYDFNFEPFSEAVVDKVMNLQMSEATFFNTALLTSFQEKFKTQSNAGAKVLVVFTDGLDEDVMKLEHQSELLRLSGVHALLAVALDGVRDSSQIQMVEFGRGFGYKVPLSVGMQSVGSTVLKQIDAVAERECCNVTCKCSGHEGSRGSRGSSAAKGGPGPKGHPGFPGEEGTAGDRGHPGPSGARGIQGCPGTRGQKGNLGHRGNKGEEGDFGLDGVDGEQGEAGLKGALGDRGRPGNAGNTGIPGEEGVKGQRGLRGDPGAAGSDNAEVGPKGDPGNAGMPGIPGKDGVNGEGGIKGNEGPRGRRGPIGENGPNGKSGIAGEAGSPGPSGSRGLQGTKGQLGPRGIQGLPGPQGRPGADGPGGLTGPPGANGQKGQQGDSGPQGVPGPLGSRGMPGQDGRDGYGITGLTGTKGDPGFPGYPGVPGDSGLDGPHGDPGPKGNLGRGGVAGYPGESGDTGGPGHPGHTGARGPPGIRNMSECQLITYIRDNCDCSQGFACPAYPTELVFGLDMSQDVTPDAFERMRSSLLALLEDVSISESNCPTGARVAVVGYSGHTKQLIRFHDYHRKNQLIEAVQNIALERTANRRHLGAAMRYVGNNMFKRVRQGVRVRKVAVFFSNGPAQDSEDIVTAMMEYRAFNIIPAVVALRQNNKIQKAFQADDTGNSIYLLLGRSPNLANDLQMIKSCVICYDPCRPLSDCASIQEIPVPQVLDVDLALVVDGSRQVQADHYSGLQELLGSVVEQVAVSRQPRRADSQARVALVQQSGSLHSQAPVPGQQAAKLEFGLQTFQGKSQMKSHVLEKMVQQGGPSALGHTLEFTLNEVLLNAISPRKNKVMMVVVGAETPSWDQAKLHQVAKEAKCKGVAVFVVALGEHYNRAQVSELASTPLEQHLICLGQLRAEEQGYAQRFIRSYLSVLKAGLNTYPPVALKKTCHLINNQQERVKDGQGQVNFNDQEQFEMLTGTRTETLLGPLDLVESNNPNPGSTTRALR